MWRDFGIVSASSRLCRGIFVFPKRFASSRSSFSVTASSMTVTRSTSGCEERIRAWSRSSFSQSRALASK